MDYLNIIKSYKYYILFAGLIIFIFYNPKTIEGFDAIDTGNGDNINKHNIKLTDRLNTDKYRNNYEQILQNKIKWCDNQILTHSVSNNLNIAEPFNEKNNKIISNINNIHAFKTTLTESLNYLDKI